MIRTIITSAFLWCLICTPSEAQYNQNLLGLKAGYGTVSILNQNNYGQREMDYGPIFDLTAGAFFSTQIGLSNHLVLEALWKKTGQDYEDIFSGSTFAKQIDIQLIEVPIFIKHFFGSANNEEDRLTEQPTGFYFLAGLSGSLILSVQYAHQINESPVDFKTFYLQGGNMHSAQIEANSNVEASDLYKPFSVGFAAGFGYQKKLSEKVCLLIELRGGASLSDINEIDWRLSNKELKYDASRHGYLTLSAGLGFGL